MTDQIFTCVYLLFTNVLLDFGKINARISLFREFGSAGIFFILADDPRGIRIFSEQDLNINPNKKDRNRRGK
jgi:hypothetical protein